MLLALAEQLGSFTALVGGSEFVHSLLVSSQIPVCPIFGSYIWEVSWPSSLEHQIQTLVFLGGFTALVGGSEFVHFLLVR